jgi:hypothetical protein
MLLLGTCNAVGSMDESKTVVWLESESVQRLRSRLRAQGNPLTFHAANERSEQMTIRVIAQHDQELIDDLIRTFDTSFAFFEQRSDLAAKKHLDELALSVISLVRVYIQDRAKL